MKPKNWCLILLAGLLFGAGLALSGMMDPSRVIGFLDFTGEWDPTLAFVMGGALLVFGIGSLIGRRKGKLPCFPADPVSKSLIIGSALFGIGWGTGRLLPGTRDRQSWRPPDRGFPFRPRHGHRHVAVPTALQPRPLRPNWESAITKKRPAVPRSPAFSAPCSQARPDSSCRPDGPVDPIFSPATPLPISK